MVSDLLANAESVFIYSKSKKIMLLKSSKIYVAGHQGLVGSAIWNNLKSRGYENLVGRSHAELDLTDQFAVHRFFDEERPEAVVLAAAFVGGINIIIESMICKPLF